MKSTQTEIELMRKSISKLPSIHEIIKVNNLTASKKFGQNYIIDSSITDRIALSLDNLTDKIVLEIGPGAGSLTRSLLLNTNVKKIIAIEKDSQFLDTLSILSALSNQRLKIIQADILRTNLNAILKSHQTNISSIDTSSTPKTFTSEIINNNINHNDVTISVVANLPYNIATVLIFDWLDTFYLKCHQDKIDDLGQHHICYKIDSMTLMVQKEVAKKIVALNGDDGYSWLSIFTQLVYNVEILFDVSNESFWPKPKVESSVLRMSLKSEKEILISSLESIKKLEYICKTAFAQRRKSLRNSLKNINFMQRRDIFKSSVREQQIVNIDIVLSELNINPLIRPEDLSILKFIQISHYL